jgi:ribose transport system permease protein
MVTYFIKRNSKIIISYGVFIIAWIIVGLFVKGYGTFNHLIYVIMVAGFLGIVSAGQTLVILTGAIDLSVGSVVTLAGVLMTQLTKSSVSFPLTVLVVILVCMFIGLFNGAGVSLLRIPPLVMTLASAEIVQGLSLVTTNGTPSAINLAYFTKWVNNPVIFGLNGIILTWIVVFIAVGILLSKTSFGRAIYFLGQNEKAAKFAGFNTKKVTIIVYILAGILSGITGILLVGYTGQSYLTMGDQYQMISISAVVVGGASILGGSGKYSGTVAGVLILTLITSVLTLFKISQGGQNAIQGAIILTLVILNSLDSVKRTN